MKANLNRKLANCYLIRLFIVSENCLLVSDQEKEHDFISVL